jgi:hypothetical protein
MRLGCTARVAMTAGALASAVLLAACGETDLGGAPNVQGLALDTANVQLERAGFSSSVTDDAMFGVIIESHFTVCEQGAPNGQLVPLEVSKQC